MKYDIEAIKRRKELHDRIKKLIYIFLVIMLYNIVLLYMTYIDKFDTPDFYIYKAYIITTTSMEPELKKDENESKILACKCSSCKDSGCSQCK